MVGKCPDWNGLSVILLGAAPAAAAGATTCLFEAAEMMLLLPLSLALLLLRVT